LKESFLREKKGKGKKNKNTAFVEHFFWQSHAACGLAFSVIFIFLSYRKKWWLNV